MLPAMGQTKTKTVFTAEARQLRAIKDVVRSGRYRSASELLREAIDEKLERLRREQLTAEVACYCEHGYDIEDPEFMAAQASEQD